MGFIKKKKCKNCKTLFIPDTRNANRQKYCSEPENREYFRGPENVIRVQQWRKNNPGFWKKSKNALAETCGMS